MNFDIEAIARLSVSPGCLYFCKFLVLALVYWFVFAVAKMTLQSINATVRQGQQHWQKSGAISGQYSSADANVPQVAHSPAFRPESEQRQVLASEPSSRTCSTFLGAVSTSSMSSTRPESAYDDDTCDSLASVSNCPGYVEIVSGVDTKIKRLAVNREIYIGRSSKCDLRLRDAFTSSRHAKLSPGARGVTLSDLKSRNGTFLNGERLESPSLLNDGDTFSIGDAVFRFTER